MNRRIVSFYVTNLGFVEGLVCPDTTLSDARTCEFRILIVVCTLIYLHTVIGVKLPLEILSTQGTMTHHKSHCSHFELYTVKYPQLDPRGVYTLG